ncbi:hypothetical protein BV20DRAFT_979262 [Pilatotrama ljubarskyi]|nr:hypothetical protein BV20DRAFT_979262 [Pilatotrama ljubarskyi]
MPGLEDSCRTRTISGPQMKARNLRAAVRLVEKGSRRPITPLHPGRRRLKTAIRVDASTTEKRSDDNAASRWKGRRDREPLSVEKATRCLRSDGKNQQITSAECTILGQTVLAAHDEGGNCRTMRVQNIGAPFPSLPSQTPKIHATRTWFPTQISCLGFLYSIEVSKIRIEGAAPIQPKLSGSSWEKTSCVYATALERRIKGARDYAIAVG